jgi:hypothetical protein
MDEPSPVAGIAWVVAVVCAINTGMGYLVRETRGVPARRRFGVMVDVAIVRTRPVQKLVLCGTAGVVGFLAAGSVCAVSG